MSFLRVSTVLSSVDLPDLGANLVHPAVNFVISDQFSADDLKNSSDLTAAVQGGTLTAQILLEGVWTSIAAADYDEKDPFGGFGNLFEIVNEIDNEKLVDGGDANKADGASKVLHHHDSRYFTEIEIQNTASGSSGAGLSGVDQTNFTVISGADVQAVLDSIDDNFASSVNLDTAYSNDSNGILDVNGTTKNLNLRSDNINDILVSRTDGTTSQNAMLFDVSADEVILGDLLAGLLSQINVRIKTNLIVDGNIQYTGTLTDSTVDTLQVTNAEIVLRDGATVGADAFLKVERGTTGTDSSIKWNETTDRWQAGLFGSEQTIALLEANEVVTGVWELQGAAITDPNFYLTQKAAAPTTQLGSASQTPMSMINGILSTYDKTNARNKWLSVSREYMTFNGRNNSNHTNEYLRVGDIPSNQSGIRLIRDATLVGMSVQTNGAETWTAEVRKNDVVTVVSSLALAAASGGQDSSLNVDFTAGDEIQVFCNGTSINRPVVRLEFAFRF